MDGLLAERHAFDHNAPVTIGVPTIPVGESPTGTGGSPVPPKLRHYPSHRKLDRACPIAAYKGGAVSLPVAAAKKSVRRRAILARYWRPGLASEGPGLASEGFPRSQLMIL